MIIIKRVKKTNLYDIFSGIGWTTHSRIARQRGYIKLISGKHLQKYQTVEIIKTLETS